MQKMVEESMKVVDRLANVDGLKPYNANFQNIKNIKRECSILISKNELKGNGNGNG